MKSFKRIIRVGDINTNNGTVTGSGASHFTVEDIAVALVGDPCSCHHECVIVEGDSEHTIDGLAVAYEGHKVSCGAKLIASAENYTKEVDDALTFRLPTPLVADEIAVEPVSEPVSEPPAEPATPAAETAELTSEASEVPLLWSPQAHRGYGSGGG